jgi:hypothetical protein
LAKKAQNPSDNFHSESIANLLIDLGPNFRIYSEQALISQKNWLDFDSAIPWFESRRPSQIAQQNQILSFSE